jgi:hypothetical protein
LKLGQKEVRQIYDQLGDKFPDVSLPHGAWNYQADAALQARNPFRLGPIATTVQAGSRANSRP